MDINNKFYCDKSILLSLLGIIILRLLLDYAYGNIISHIFGYYNFSNQPSAFSFILSYLVLLALSPLIIKTIHDDKLSSNILTMLIVTSLLPTTTMIAYNSLYSYTYIILTFVYWFLLLFSSLYTPRISILTRYKIKSEWPLVLMVVFICGVIVYVSWKYTGLRFHFGLMDVYSIRTEARGYQVSTLIGYIVTAADNLLPILFTFFLINKQKIFATFIAIIIFLNFGISAAKMVLFLLFFAYISYLFVKSTHIFRYASWGTSVLIGFCIIEFNVFNTYVLTNFSLFRIFFIPAKLHYIYYDFFSINEFDYFRQSALKFFFESPYSKNIQFLIGYHDIKDITARANNGLFSDAYLNFGALGVFIFPFIIVLILKILESSAYELNPKLIFVITTSVCFVLLSVPFTQALFTSGIFLLIFLLYFMPRNKKS